MGQALLVSVDIPMGARILQALDEAGLNIKVAAWMVLPEYEDWRLILASRTFDEAGTLKAFRLIREALIPRKSRLCSGQPSSRSL